MSSGRDT